VPVASAFSGADVVRVRLLNDAEVIQDLYRLGLADGWRGRFEEPMFEDTDSEMLYQNAMDGFDCDVELNTQLGRTQMELKDWFKSFNDSWFRPSCADHETKRPYFTVLFKRR
jgi:hypothetical protein